MEPWGIQDTAFGVARVAVDRLDVHASRELPRIAVIEGCIHHRAPDGGKQKGQADEQGSNPRGCGARHGHKV